MRPHPDRRPPPRPARAPRGIRPAAAALAAAMVLSLPSAHAFQKEAGPPKGCAECHRLTQAEAEKLLGRFVERVVGVGEGPFQGIWEVVVEKGGKKYPLYVDYSGRFLFNGQVIRMADMENLTGQRFVDLNRVDFASIPLTHAVVLGNPKSARKVVVFEDPDCPWCRKLHGEIQQVVAKDPDVGFYLIVYSRNNNPKTVEKAKAVLCGKENAARLLDDAFAGKALPKAECRTAAVEENRKLADRLGITGTPAMILSDGRTLNGYLPAEKLLEELKGL